MYDPIYSQNIGLCGFRFRVGDCKRVVRSYRGIVMHCRRVHGLTAQIEFPFPKENKDETKTGTELQPIRGAETTTSDSRAGSNSAS
jgi:hypothetical protein